MADREVTIPLRAGYAARGRRGTGRAGWHAVSEEVRVPVTCMRMADAPVAFRIERPLDHRTENDRQAWGDRPWRAIPPLPATGRGTQCLDIRMSPDGVLLAPVPGPWGSGTLSPEALAAYALEVLAIDGGLDRRGRMFWGGYPGQIPVPRMRPRSYQDWWPAPAEGSPNRPAAACPDLAGERLTVDEGLRAVALAAFRDRCAGLSLLDWTVWRPCGTPLVAIDRDGRGRLVVPGHDTEESVERDTLALADVGNPAGRGHMPAVGTVEAAPGAPVADVEGRNVRSLAAHVGSTVRAVRLGGLSPAWLPLVHHLATAETSTGGQAAWGLSDATLALVRNAAAAWGAGQPRPGSPDATLLDLALRWAAVQEGERDTRERRHTERPTTP